MSRSVYIALGAAFFGGAWIGAFAPPALMFPLAVAFGLAVAAIYWYFL